MSFEFSQNLLADIGSSQSPTSSLSLSTSTSVNPSAASQLQKSQSCLSQEMPFSQNLLDIDDNSQSQIVTSISQPYRSQILSQQQSLNIPGRSNFVQNRVPASRLNATPERINGNVANALKQVQNRLEDFPVIVSRMLEEGLDYVEKDFKATADKSEEELKILTNAMDMMKNQVKEKDEKVKSFIEKIIGEFNSMSMTLEKLKRDKGKYLELIDTLQMTIDQQKKIIDKLKLEVSSFKTETKTIRVRSMDKLVESSISPRPIIRDIGNLIPETRDDFIITPRSLLKPILTPTSSESVRKFSLDDIIAVSDEEDEDPEEEAINIDSSSLDIDFSDIFTIESDEEMMVEE